MSKIEWTEKTWNPTIGCTKVSTGCKNCYAEVMAKRLQAMGNKDYAEGFRFKVLSSRLDYPRTIKKPTVFFVNSMSDLFHEQIPASFLNKVFDVIAQTPQHTYQVLTKRARRMLEYCIDKEIPDNVLLGATVENRQAVKRIDYLRRINTHQNTRGRQAKYPRRAGKMPAAGRLACRRQVKKFLSIEPLLEDLGDLNLSGIDWVIVGGESGHKARPMLKEWAISVKEQCERQNIPFFFKQWGTYGEDGIKRNKKANGRLLLNREWNQTLNW